jgi:chorismate mutase/prephenate dehydratase
MPPRSISTADRLDAIDEKIHDLLIERAALAEKLPVASPAQQAMSLRRLVARHKGKLALSGLVGIWREVLASMPGAAPSAHVFAGNQTAFYRDLARAYFGSAASIEGHPSASAVIHACAGDPAAVGLVPPPDSDENQRPWWAQLTPSGQAGPRVIARLPLMETSETQAIAYAIGTLEQEPTGDDTSMIILEANADLSRTKLQSLIRQAGFEAQLVAVGRDSPRSASRLHLLEIAGFVARDDSRLGSLLEQAGDAIVRLVSVGGYADPIRPPKAV